MKTCPGCGKSCSDNSAFCGFCGFPLKDVTSSEEKDTTEKTNIFVEKAEVKETPVEAARETAPIEKAPAEKPAETSNSVYSGESVYSSEPKEPSKPQPTPQPIINNQPTYNKPQQPPVTQPPVAPNYNRPKPTYTPVPTPPPAPNYNNNNYNNNNQNYSQPNFNRPNNYQQNYNRPNYNPQPSYNQPVPPNNDPMATASLVLGIVGIVFLCCYGIGIIPAILAIIFGCVARNRIKESNGTVGGSGLATAGLAMGIGAVAFAVLMIIIIVVGVAIGASYTDDFEREFRNFGGSTHYTNAKIALSMLFNR